ncbi:MAG: oxidoreductase [Chitinophagaceae bacterium]
MWTKKDVPDQTGRTVIVTGANVGIGFETTLALYEAGANVILACRNPKSAEDTLGKLQELKGKGTLETGVLDLADLNSVKEFANIFIQKHKRLDLLINNAGVSMPPASKTTEGYELQFGVNFLGHFALTGHLYPFLKETPDSRIITVSSNGYQVAVIDFDNLKSEVSYDPMREYRQSKLADLIFSVELHRRIIAKGHKVLSIAAQPGANKTELTRHLSEEVIAAGIARIGEFMEPWQGALTSLYAAVSNEARGGNLYEPDNGGYRGYPTLATIKENALDRTVAKRLWNLAEQVTGVHYPT